MNKFELKDITCGYKKTKVLTDVSFEMGAGESLVLLGPNGVGKTTLFKTMLGFLKPLGGTVEFDGEAIADWGPRKLAQKIGYVPQSHTPPFAYPVIDVVTMGRLSRIGAMASPSAHDEQVAYECLERLGVAHLADKLYTEVSGGERQMTLIARSLAQEPEMLVMDEPTAALDYGNQVRVLNQVSRLVDEGLSVVMTTHFPDHAFLCATKVGLVTRTGIVVGPPEEIVTEESLRRTYGVDVRIVQRDTYDKGLLTGCIPIIEFTAGSCRCHRHAGCEGGCGSSSACSC